MPPNSRKRKDTRRRRREEDDAASFVPIARGRHVHTHELHGFGQVWGLRRRFRASLGYVPREP